MKMTDELAALFRTCKNIRVMDAGTGQLLDSIDGEKPGELAFMSTVYQGATVHCINPGTEIRNGETVEILQIWVEI